MKARRSTSDTPSRILAKADELFRRYGAAKTTIADIAGALGMSSANIYRHFPTRNALLEASAERNIATVRSAVTLLAAGPGSAISRIERIVLAIFRFHKDLLRSERQVYRLVLLAIEEDWACVKTYNDFLLDTFTRLIRDGIAAGEFRRAPLRPTAHAVLDCLSIALHPHLRHDFTHDASESRVRAQIRLIDRALR